MKRVVLVGAGYTSVWAYRAIVRRMPRAHVTVVTERPRHSFHGYTAETLAGRLTVGAANSSVAEACPRARVLIGAVTDVDPEHRTVGVAGPDGACSRLAYDELVVATGARERLDSVPGLAEHGHGLRHEHTLSALRARLHAALDEPGTTEVAVVGGGLAGVETAAAIAQLDPRLRVCLLSSGRPAAQLADVPGGCERVMTELERCGVRVRSGVRAAAVDASGVDLTDGSRVEAPIVVSALGSAATALPGLEPHAQPDGRLVVDRTLAVRPGVWAAGDCAAMPRPEGSAQPWYPADALHAINAGTRAGRNVVAGLRGRRPREFRYTELGKIATFGRSRAVGSMLGVPLGGLPLALIRQVLFVWFIPSRRQALRMLRWRTTAPVTTRRLTAAAPRTALA